MKPLMIICGVAVLAASAASVADPPKPATPVTEPTLPVRPTVKNVLTASHAYREQTGQPQVHCDKADPGCKHTTLDDGAVDRPLSNHGGGPAPAADGGIALVPPPTPPQLPCFTPPEFCPVVLPTQTTPEIAPPK